jgi:hypothetical protein
LLVFRVRDGTATVQRKFLTASRAQFSDIVVQVVKQWIGSSPSESEMVTFIPTISADIPKRDAVVEAFRVRQRTVLQSSPSN